MAGQVVTVEDAVGYKRVSLLLATSSLPTGRQRESLNSFLHGRTAAERTIDVLQKALRAARRNSLYSLTDAGAHAAVLMARALCER